MNCPICDRPPATAEQWKSKAPLESVCFEGHECSDHAVDWRSRALSAEARLPELEALAESARLDCIEAYRQCDQVGGGQAESRIRDLEIEVARQRARADAAELELTRHEVTCGWRRADDTDEPIRRIHRSYEEIVAQACRPGLTPKERGEKLLAAWRTFFGAGGPGVGTRMQMAEDVRRVVEGALIHTAEQERKP